MMPGDAINFPRVDIPQIEVALDIAVTYLDRPGELDHVARQLLGTQPPGYPGMRCVAVQPLRRGRSGSNTMSMSEAIGAPMRQALATYWPVIPAAGAGGREMAA